jgi:hydrogenase expression/formation protein HypE
LLRATGMGVILQQERVPVRDPVQSVCDMLGYDPLYLACEGRVVAVVDDAHADALLQSWRRLPCGSAAACIGHLSATRRHVVLQTGLGGERLLEELEDDPLPRIC